MDNEPALRDRSFSLHGAFGVSAGLPVLVRAISTEGIWRVTQDAVAVGDYTKPEAALCAMVKLAVKIEHGGGAADVLFEGPQEVNDVQGA